MKRAAILWCLAGAAGLAWSSGTAVASAAEPLVPCVDPRGCPDLVTDPATMAPHVQVSEIEPTDCQVAEGSTQPGVRRLLRFTFTTPNVGAGDLVVGSPEDHPEWFEYSPCHGHYHFKEYADYRLWKPAQQQRYEAIRAANPRLTAAQVLAANRGLAPVRGEKAGFCVIDVVRYQVLAVTKYLSCGFQGISVGWADQYDASLDGQFVDVTGVAPGSYVLEAEVNAERFYEESDYANNRAYVAVTIR
jgi:hypothetical protein